MSTTTLDEVQYLNVREVVDLLRISIRKTYELVREGELPSVRRR